MSTVKIKVDGHVANFMNFPLLATGSEKIDKVQAEFDSEWDGLGIVAVFYQDKGKLSYGVITLNNTTNIPESALRAEGAVNIGFFGTDGSKKITTNVLTYEIKEGAYISIEDPEPDVYQQILGSFGSIVESLKLKTDKTELDKLAGKVEQKADKTQITTPFNNKGACLSTALPTSGNVLNDTWYCTDLMYRMTWNGTEWFQSSISEVDYEVELGSLKEDMDNIQYSRKSVEYTSSLFSTTTMNSENVKVNKGDVILISAPSSGSYCYQIYRYNENGTKLDTSDNAWNNVLSNDNVANMEVDWNGYVSITICFYDRRNISSNIEQQEYLSSRMVVMRDGGINGVSSKLAKAKNDDTETIRKAMQDDKIGFNFANIIWSYLWFDTKWVSSTNKKFLGSEIIDVSNFKTLNLECLHKSTKLGFYIARYDGTGVDNYMTQAIYYTDTQGIDITDWQYARFIVMNNGFGDLPTDAYKYFDLGIAFTPSYKAISVENTQANIPKNIYCIVGKEMNIYYDNVVLDSEKYDVHANYVSGVMTLEHKLRILKNEQGTISPAISFFQNNEEYIKALNTITPNVIYKSKYAGENKTVSIMMIGDSNTNNLAISDYIYNTGNELLSVNMLGTQGTAPKKHEGYPGKTSAFIVGSASPFYNPTTQNFDFSYYMNKYGYSSVDVVTIMFGTNDLFDVSADITMYNYIDSIIARYKIMLNSIHAFDENINVAFMLTIPSANSRNSIYSHGLDAFKRDLYYLNRRILKEFDNRESENIYVLATNCNLDTVYNYGKQTISVNAYNDDDTIDYYNNPLHPLQSGYGQLGDVVQGLINHVATK